MMVMKEKDEEEANVWHYRQVTSKLTDAMS